MILRVHSNFVVAAMGICSFFGALGNSLGGWWPLPIGALGGAVGFLAVYAGSEVKR